MKKYLVYLSIILVALASCKGNQKQAEEEDENPYEVKPEMELSTRDTLGVMDACTAYFDKLVAQDYEGAVSMLKVLNQDTKKIEELSDSLHTQELMRAKMFPVYGYEVESIQFHTETDSKAKYYIFISPKEEGKEQAKMSVTFRPVREGNTWYLTLANSATEKEASVLDLTD